MKKSEREKYVWYDRKRIIFGLPWSFTRYKLLEKKLIIDTGFFSRTEDEIRLYRIMDITLKRSFFERIFGLGTIHCCTSDKTSPEFDIAHIKKSPEVKELLSDMVERERKEHRIGIRENVINDYDMDEHDDTDPEN